MSKKKILISAPYLQLELSKYKEMLESHFELVVPEVDERLSETQLFEIFEENNWDIYGCIVGDDYFTENFYDRSQDSPLKVVVKWGTGIDSLNKSYANNVGIKVLNTPSAFTIPVSESAIGMMLNFCRKIEESNHQMENDIWTKVQGFTLNESKVGIIGLGNIGTEVAHKLESFGSEISYYDPNVNNFKYQRYDTVEDLIKNNDIITIHCDLNNTSHHLINDDNIDMFEDKILINTARGPIIDNGSLEAFTSESNSILVGLDVFETEPLPKGHWFRKNRNFIISSHNTNTSQKFWKNVHENCIKMIIKESHDYSSNIDLEHDCDCFHGIVVCSGCNGVNKSKLGVCTGCNGTGTRHCGKCNKLK